MPRETPGAFYVNQYHNKLNIDAHLAEAIQYRPRRVE